MFAGARHCRVGTILQHSALTLCAAHCVCSIVWVCPLHLAVAARIAFFLLLICTDQICFCLRYAAVGSSLLRR